jgi:hypothetical protein
VSPTSLTGASRLSRQTRAIVGCLCPPNPDREHSHHIDLLGVSRAGLPPVIELKKGSSSETPLCGLIEGFANAVAVRENWRGISLEIQQLWAKKQPNLPLPTRPEPMAVQLLAPRMYWEKWDKRGRLTAEADGRTRREFQRLRSVAEAHGFPSSFAPSTGLVRRGQAHARPSCAGR